MQPPQHLRFVLDQVIGAGIAGDLEDSLDLTALRLKAAAIDGGVALTTIGLKR